MSEPSWLPLNGSTVQVVNTCVLSFFSKFLGELFVNLQVLDTDSRPLPREDLHKVSFADGRDGDLPTTKGVEH
jgi:hypothetical protein